MPHPYPLLVFLRKVPYCAIGAIGSKRSATGVLTEETRGRTIRRSDVTTST